MTVWIKISHMGSQVYIYEGSQDHTSTLIYIFMLHPLHINSSVLVIQRLLAFYSLCQTPPSYPRQITLQNTEKSLMKLSRKLQTLKHSEWDGGWPKQLQSERLEKELGRLLCTVNGNSRVLDSDAMLIPIREKKPINHNEVSWLQVNTVQSNNNNFAYIIM